MARRLGSFVGGTLGLWILLAVPGRYLWGDSAFWFSLTAACLCLLPTSLTLAWAWWAFRTSPDQQLTAILGGSAVRLFVVVGAAFLLYQSAPPFQKQGAFLAWVFVFYMFTLAFEVALVLVSRPGPPHSAS